jgi:hypothetical protein
MKVDASSTPDLYMFEDSSPSECEHRFQSECPPDAKVKVEDLFKFSASAVIFRCPLWRAFWPYFSLRSSGPKRAGIIASCQTILARMLPINSDGQRSTDASRDWAGSLNNRGSPRCCVYWCLFLLRYGICARLGVRLHGVNGFYCRQARILS